MIPDSVPEVLAPADHPSPQGPPVVLCNGPTGPCVLELGHGGDHIRPLRTTEEDVIEGIRALKAENAELRRLLKTAGILLADWQQRRGGFLRRGLVQRIAEVLA
jgi:hypothetical protein